MSTVRGTQNGTKFYPIISSLAGTLAVLLITFLCRRFQLDLPTPTCLYLLVIVVVSVKGGFLSSVIVSVIAVGFLDYYFVPPIFSVRLGGPANYIALLAFLTTSAVIAHFVTRIHRSEGLVEKANILDLTHDTIFLRDMNNVITFWNRGAEELYGWTADAVVGRITHELLQTVFPSPLEEIDSSLLRTDRWEGELKHTKADGTQLIVASRWSLQRDERQKPVAILELNNDITSRRLAEDVLRRQANLLEQTHDAIIVWEFRNNIIFWNRAAENLYGYSREEAIGRLSHELLQTKHPMPTQLFEAHLEREGHWTGELTQTARDGREILVDSRHVVVREPDGRTLVLETSRDITERRRTEESLQQAQANLARVNRVMLVGEMTASIAHEVNQPIGAVVTSAGACMRWLAAQPPEMEKARQALERIIRDGSRAGEVIRRVRALVKKVPPHTDLFNINDAILEIIALTENELQKHQIEVRAELSNSMPLVPADRVQMQQVILNLIVNAIDAMSSINNRTRELVLNSGESTSNEVFVEVRDSGIGLDDMNLNQMFDSFYSTKPEGIGMGLSISRAIVEAHGGRLWATPNEPYGAVFRFVLPLQGDHNE